MTINGKTYDNKNILVIAEIGTSHNGELSKAKELIDAAAESGADCVKTQIFYADEILHPKTGTVPLPSGNVPLFDVFKKLEAPIDFYREIKNYTESKGLLFLASPFGQRSAAELYSLNPAFVKIASPELNYVQLLKTVSEWKIPVLLSGGVSKLSDIETALSFFEKKDVCLLHCITSYPAPESEYNLRVIQNISNIFGVSAGVSDHSLNPVLIPVLSAACGASVIEKHFCLSHDGGGLDDKIALPPRDFGLMVSAVRRAQNMDAGHIIQGLKSDMGKTAVDAALGTGIKQLAPSEEANYNRTNRSVHALCDIQEGEEITAHNTAVLRTEKILRPGLEPVFWERIIGRRTSLFIPSGEGVRLEDLTIIR
ncbi:spore coat protein [Spirochaetia bacterium]|nr:spore coat protein [Spirochaetia bacterium]